MNRTEYGAAIFGEFVRELLAPQIERKPRNTGKHGMTVSVDGVDVDVGYDIDADGYYIFCAAWIGGVDVTALEDRLGLQTLIDDAHDEAKRDQQIDDLHKGKRGAW